LDATRRPKAPARSTNSAPRDPGGGGTARNALHLLGSPAAGAAQPPSTPLPGRASPRRSVCGPGMRAAPLPALAGAGSWIPRLFPLLSRSTGCLLHAGAGSARMIRPDHRTPEQSGLFWGEYHRAACRLLRRGFGQARRECQWDHRPYPGAAWATPVCPSLRLGIVSGAIPLRVASQPAGS
jgi:hypothetical protein